MVTGIPAEEISGLWETIKPLIERGLQYSDGTITAEQIGVELLRGKKQLLFSPEPLCILITELLNYSNGRKVCDVALTAGKFPGDWRTVLSGIEDWARDKGCSDIQMQSPRKAWTRRLPDWRPVTVVYRKDLRP